MLEMFHYCVKLSSPDAQATGFNDYFHSIFGNPLNDASNDL